MNIKFGSDEGESCIKLSLHGVKCSLLFQTTVLYSYKIEEIYGIVSYQDFSVLVVLYTLACESQVHGAYVYVTSGLLSWSSGSTSVAHFNPESNTHFGMRIYVVIKIVSYTKILRIVRL